MEPQAIVSQEEGVTLDRVIAFIRSLGIGVDERAMFRPTLVPGIDIVNGGLVVEASLLCKPADLLHEAGHIALTKPADRPSLDGTITSTPTEEMATIGWTWAAAMHLGIPPEEVFHEEVISGNGGWLLENFAAGRFIGVPMLEFWGLAARKSAQMNGAKPYPHMMRWVRDG